MTHRVTIVDVAGHAGVSVSAASKAVRGAYGVSEHMKGRVQRSVDALGYRPHRLAQGMRGRMSTIGVLLTDLENPFMAGLIDGVSTELARSGYEFFVAPAGNSASAQDRVTNALIDHRMDGLVLIAPRGTPERLEQIAREVPMVIIGRHGASDAYDTVSSDDLLGSRLVVEHLVSLGHQDIAFLANVQPDHDPSLPESYREAGYRAAMAVHGLEDRVSIIAGEWSFEGGRKAAQGLLALADMPSAVHAGADIAALGLLNEFWESGVSVPGTMSVVGYDNTPTAALRPISLTSVDQGGVELGAASARLLLERLAGRNDPVHVELEPRLVVRATTAQLARRGDREGFV